MKWSTMHISPVQFSAAEIVIPLRRLWFVCPLLLTWLLLSGCAPGFALPQTADPADSQSEQAGATLPNFTIPQPTPIVPPDVTAIVTTGDRRANVRSGPGLDFDVISAADSGTRFQVVAKNEAEDWWQVCCIRGAGDAVDEATTLAWLSEIVVDIEGDPAEVPVFRPLLPGELAAEWEVDWTCGSERCEIQECTATVTAEAADVISRQWLQIDHNVTWDETCFATDEWLFEVNQFTGVERSGDEQESFLYRYWVGPQPGEVNRIVMLDDGREIGAWCSGPHQVEVEVGDGWNTVYEGDTCHDVRTGMLLTLSYEKRWLFTGEFDGNSYENEYFGDFEVLEQKLVDTTADLYVLNEPASSPTPADDTVDETAAGESVAGETSSDTTAEEDAEGTE